MTPISRPQPKPDIALRPLKMSVTEIEDWLRDPYTIYAKRILKLVPLDPVDMPLTAADRGSAIHQTLSEFTTRFATMLPPDAVAVLHEIGKTHFSSLIKHPEAQALWWPRFLRIAVWFVGWESKQRESVNKIETEISGKIHIPLGNNRAFILSARADRIEQRSDGTFAILDYKTGSPPTGKQVFMGLSPQLTLEAAILRGGGFTDIPDHSSVSELTYVHLSGNDPAGKATPLELKIGNSDTPQLPNDAADTALRKLTALIHQFEKQEQSYNSLNLSMWSNRYGKYDDLARIKEWSAIGGVNGSDE